MQWAKKQKGFTIVELLIVVVVIAILAAITIVAYNGIQNRSKQSAVQASLVQAVKTIELAKVANTAGTYPDSQANANIKSGSGVTLTYTYNATSNAYCVQAVNGTIQYSATNFSTDPVVGGCATNGLVGWWPLNGNGNNSAGSLPVTLTGTPTTGQNGQTNSAYAFTGTQTGNVAGSESIIPDTMTFSFWVRPVAWTSSTATSFIGKRSSSSNNGVFIMYLNSSSSLAIDCGGSSNRWTTGFVPQFNQWTHIVVSCSSIELAAYANGSLLGTTTRSSMNLSNATELGFGHDRGSYYLDGSMDDIRLYNRALSLAEVQQLFSNGAQ